MDMNRHKKTKKIRKGDKVIAISGNDRGRSGAVLAILGDRAVVQGLNVRKKHVKKSQAHPKGDIVKLESSIHLSNLCLCVDESPVKVKVRVDGDGNRQFFYKEGDKEILYRSVKQPRE